MAISLDHTIVPSLDQDAAATFFARMFDLEYEGPAHFSAVRVNDALTLLFSNDPSTGHGHYAFVVEEAEFDAIFGRIKDDGISFGSGPGSASDGKINTRRGGRGLYFMGGPDQHLWEIMTTKETGT